MQSHVFAAHSQTNKALPALRQLLQAGLIHRHCGVSPLSLCLGFPLAFHLCVCVLVRCMQLPSKLTWKLDICTSVWSLCHHHRLYLDTSQSKVIVHDQDVSLLDLQDLFTRSLSIGPPLAMVKAKCHANVHVAQTT